MTMKSQREVATVHLKKNISKVGKKAHPFLEVKMRIIDLKKDDKDQFKS